MRIRRVVTGLWLGLTACGGSGDDGYVGRGTVEVPEVDVAATVPARVVAVRVDEGDVVRAGDTLALMTQVELGATLAAQRARVATAEANLHELEAGARPEEIRRARAELAAAEAEQERATKDLARSTRLVADNAIARASHDAAVAAEQSARARRDVAREALELLEAGTRQERVAAARAEVAAARAALAQIEARAGELVLTAPVAGTILTRAAEPGEPLGANVPVLSLGETGRPYVRVYLPQHVVAGLAVGDSVEVAAGLVRAPGKVLAINPRAEFTPRVALTEEERADLMFGVKVAIEGDPAGLHPGLWVTVRVRTPGRH